VLPEQLLSLNEVADGFRDFWVFQPPFQFGVFALPKPSQYLSDAGNEAEPAFQEEKDGSQQDQDSGSSAADNARFIEDFEVLFHGGVGSFGGGTEFLDLLVALGASREFVDESRVILEGHVFDEAGAVPEMGA